MRMVKMTRSPKPVALAVAMTAALAAQAPAVDTDPPTVMDVRADGVVLPGAVLDFAPASIVVTFSEDVDPATVSTDTFRLMRSGGDGTFGDGNEVEVRPASVMVSPGNVATADLTAATFVDDDYQVTVSGGGPTDSLVAHWRFDETSGTTTADSSGNGNDGVLVNGPVWQPTGGRIGGAASFDGTDDRVTVARDAALEPTSAITVAVWGYITDSAASGTGDLVRKEGPGDAGFLLRWSSGNAILEWHVAWSSRPNIVLRDTQGNAAYLGAWHHYAASFDSGTGEAVLYVDGVARNSLVTTPAVLEHTDDLFFMGQVYGGHDIIPGLLDDARIYDRPLSASEVAALAGPPPVTDLSANPLDGEFTGSFPPSGDGTAGGDFVCAFEITAPAVLATSPANGATDVPVGATLEAVFSRAMDPASTEAAFVVSGGVTGTKSWAGNSLLLTPSQPLEYEHYYTVTITTDAVDATGIALADTYTFAFTTAAEGGGGDTDTPFGGGCGAVGETPPVGWLVPVGLLALALSRRRRKAASA